MTQFIIIDPPTPAGSITERDADIHSPGAEDKSPRPAQVASGYG